MAEGGAERVGVSADRLHAATLLDAEAALGGERPGFLPLVLAAGIYHRARRRHGLQYCPDCLTERPMIYRRTWRSALAVVCIRHDRRLRDACPRCDRALAPHRSRRLNRDLCDCCGDSLIHEPAGPGPRVPGQVASVQAALLPGLLDAEPTAVEEACDLRALLGVLASNVPVDRLACALGVPDRSGLTRPSGVFEASSAHRPCGEPRSRCGLASELAGELPRRCRAMGLSVRHFAGRRIGPALAAEIARLPTPVRRLRGPAPAPGSHRRPAAARA